MNTFYYISMPKYTPAEPDWSKVDNFDDLMKDAHSEKSGLLQRLFNLGR